MSSLYTFPKDFLWGCATASYQVEGAANEDGRGPSIWDTFSHAPGRVAMDHNGDVAVDQYHRYRDDVQLLKSLGAKAYRFSISWSRIFPDGDGAPNPLGVAYYDRLVDELLKNDIQPWVTFFHWDLPQAMEDRFGGWESQETSKRFADYAGYMTGKLSDRVRNYFTINEFCCFTSMGYENGGPFPPGKKLLPGAASQVRHNGVLAHGLAALAIRANARQKPNVGLAENSNIPIPIIETPEHIQAARVALRELNAAFLTAVMEGRYTDAYLKGLGADAPKFTAEEMKIIGTPLDFVGLNLYSGSYVRADSANPLGYSVVNHQEGYPRMDSPWLYLVPPALYWGPRLAAEEWGVKAIYITENGCSCKDKLTLDKQVLDTDRVMYLRNYLTAAQRATAEGYPLKGYFLWSLLDNFEWAEGYTKRFGITYVNYETLERIPKLSAHWYREVIAANRVM